MKSLIPFLTLIEREYYRFARLAAQTIAPPIIMTLLFVVIFGYSLGQGIQTVLGLPYIVYILPGLAGMGVITNSYSNSSTSLFMARIDRSIENIVVAPIAPIKIALAFVIGGVTRGVAVGGVTLLVASLLTDLAFHHLLLMVVLLLALATTFSSLGIVSALWAEDWDHLATFSNFFITPMIYLGGVFYSIATLPPLWQKVSYANPMLYLIDGFRFSVLGVSDLSPILTIGISVGLAAVAFSLAVWLFRVGYKIIV